MNAWLATIVGESAAPIVGFILLFILVIALLLLVFAILRRVTGGTFVAGGRNRQVRLSVTDAAAVDNRRRLVLVRRDDVEHLILIGGPSDLVIEQNIRQFARQPRVEPPASGPTPEPEPRIPEPKPEPKSRKRHLAHSPVSHLQPLRFTRLPHLFRQRQRRRYRCVRHRRSSRSRQGGRPNHRDRPSNLPPCHPRRPCNPFHRYRRPRK